MKIPTKSGFYEVWCKMTAHVLLALGIAYATLAMVLIAVVLLPLLVVAIVLDRKPENHNDVEW